MSSRLGVLATDQQALVLVEPRLDTGEGTEEAGSGFDVVRGHVVSMTRSVPQWGRLRGAAAYARQTDGSCSQPSGA
ncbi:hypothetical protein Krad_2558 [Kineococcus radiotolerans SRS30216 = ATCC BAA-149]|uniref:Uncharacterized protein n=1 Tax=Kineococcus radiotolerans (strain ATCC BAA-149 / DSM 14245 / SRS30216) TaxID=266940 RepID=A6WB44_KINRD|nr:hypothetical protein Krad_2558 [Kineococcus radiotolerans SRS30216 = ATCC BAA-149]